MLDFHSCWSLTPAPAPGVAPGAFQHWESMYKVSLPITLKGLLNVHDGGRIERLGVRYDLLPLNQLQPLSEDCIRQLLRVEPNKVLEAMLAASVPHLWLVFPFLVSSTRRVYFLAYPEHTMKSEPELYIWLDGTVRHAHRLAEDFLEEIMQLSDYPAVDLREAASMQIMADESVCLPTQDSPTALCHTRQVLGKRDGQWFLFVQEIVSDNNVMISERRIRMAMSSPLKLLSPEVRLFRPSQGPFPAVWSLGITPLHKADTLFTQSLCTSSGKWQSEELHGEPTSFTLESTDDARLHALCALLSPSSIKPVKPRSTIPLVQPQKILPPTSIPEPSASPTRFISPNVDAVTESLRRMTESAIRGPRARMAV